MEYEGEEIIKIQIWEYYRLLKVLNKKTDQDLDWKKVEFIYIPRELFDKWQNYEKEIRKKIRKIQSWSLKRRRQNFVKVSKYDFYGYYEWCAENSIVEGNTLCCFDSWPFPYISAIETYHYNNKRGGYYTYELSKTDYARRKSKKHEYEDFVQERMIKNGFLPYYKGLLEDDAKRRKEQENAQK